MRQFAPARPAHPSTPAVLPPGRAFAPTAASAARHDFARVPVSAPVQRAGGGDAPAHAIRQAASAGVRTAAGAFPFAERVQRSFGRHPVGPVRAHVGAAAERSADAMRASAFAMGEHVVFGGAPDLRTAAHEAAHVVQQRAGVRPPGGIGREADPWERHADAVADAVVAGRSAEGLLEPFAAPPAGAQPAGAAVQRAPKRIGKTNEYQDADVPGFTFVRPDPKKHHYVIKGSDVTVVHDPKEGRYTTPSGTVVHFQDSSTRPVVAEKRDVPESDDRDWNYFHLPMRDFNMMSATDQAEQITELNEKFGPTDYEAQLLAQADDPDTGTYYRYHKFPADETGQAMVLGGGINKTQITPEWQGHNVKKLVGTRHSLLGRLGSGDLATRRNVMQGAQANAMSTPFIATTDNPEYAHDLVRQYPPSYGQRGVVLKIKGPRKNAFDFESEFSRLGTSGGGRPEWNFRDSATRAKDAGQAEFGLPDLFIPMRGRSPFGFRVSHVHDPGYPGPERPLRPAPLALMGPDADEDEAPASTAGGGRSYLTLDQQRQLLRARNQPTESERALREAREKERRDGH